LLAIFPPNCFQEIWINFPEPHPKKKRAKNRFTHPRYLNMYATLLKPGGTLHLKTDHSELFEWSLEQLEKSAFQIETVHRNLYETEEALLPRIITCYEKNFLAEERPISYCMARCFKET
jgi:tRNA (guanine-N7-)-methyltransferase